GGSAACRGSTRANEQLPCPLRTRWPGDSHRRRDSHPCPLGALTPIPKRDEAAYLKTDNNRWRSTPLTNRAFRATRGLVGGLPLLLAAITGAALLTACGAPQYTYVADSSAKTYYKVPHEWHQISQNDLAAALKAAGGSAAGVWSTAFDAGTAPSADH